MKGVPCYTYLVFVKGPVSKLHLKVSALHQVCNFKGHSIFQIAGLLQTAKCEIFRNLDTQPYFYDQPLPFNFVPNYDKDALYHLLLFLSLPVFLYLSLKLFVTVS